MNTTSFLFIGKNDSSRQLVQQITESTDISADVLYCSPGTSKIDLDCSRTFSAILVDSTAPGSLETLSVLSKSLSEKEQSPSVIFLIAEMKDYFSLHHGLQVSVVDYLHIPVNPAVISYKLEHYFEHGRTRNLLKIARQQLDEKDLEIEVLRNELEEKKDCFEALSSQDGLTGLFNRRYFDDNLIKEWKQGLRSEMSLAMLVIDIDYLREYNACYGYMEGDECLRRVAVALYEALLRPIDIVARYRGEAFAAMLPETDLSGAEKVAVRMLKKISELGLEHERSPVAKRLTVSIGGAAVVPNKGMKPEQLIEAADHYLFAAKEAGRNCRKIGKVN